MAARETMTDVELLELMHARDAEGVTAKVMAARLGRTRNAICGVWFRIDRDADAEEARSLAPGEVGYGAGPAVRPENLDGGMPERWWVRT